MNSLIWITTPSLLIPSFKILYNWFTVAYKINIPLTLSNSQIIIYLSLKYDSTLSYTDLEMYVVLPHIIEEWTTLYTKQIFRVFKLCSKREQPIQSRFTNRKFLQKHLEMVTGGLFQFSISILKTWHSCWKIQYISPIIQNLSTQLKNSSSKNNIYIFYSQSFSLYPGYFLANSFESQSNPSYRPCPWVAQVAWMYHWKINQH